MKKMIQNVQQMQVRFDFFFRSRRSHESLTILSVYCRLCVSPWESPTSGTYLYSGAPFSSSMCTAMEKRFQNAGSRGTAIFCDAQSFEFPLEFSVSMSLPM